MGVVASLSYIEFSVLMDGSDYDHVNVLLFITRKCTATIDYQPQPVAALTLFHVYPVFHNTGVLRNPA